MTTPLLTYEVLLVPKGHLVIAHLDELDITVSGNDIPDALDAVYAKATKRLKEYTRDGFPIPGKAHKQLTTIELPHPRAQAHRFRRRGRRHLHVVRDTTAGHR